MGGCQDRGAMKISSDGRAPLNVVDAFWAMRWSDVVELDKYTGLFGPGYKGLPDLLLGM